MLAVSRSVVNPWTNCRGLPPSAAAVLAALHLQAPEAGGLGRLSERQWREALDYSDRSRLTLLLRDAASSSMPAWVRERTDQNAACNRNRLRLLEIIYGHVGGGLQAAGVEFVALKGLTHGGWFGVQPESRMQYDIDLFVPLASVQTARDVLISLGYEPIEGTEHFPTDHLPAMVRKTPWEWRGDYFDVEIPTPIELHYRFWNEQNEGFRAPGAERFWERRTPRRIAGIDLHALSPSDLLGYAALHSLRHLLRGSVHPSHVYEIAACLDLRSEDDAFWREWRTLHAPELRRLQAVVFRLAQTWFGCRVADTPADEVARLPDGVRAWFDVFALSPARAPFDSNKDEIWLHGALLDSRRHAWSMVRRRMLPGRLPLRTRGSYLPENQWNWARRAKERLSYASHIVSRIAHHALALPRTAVSGARWRWSRRGARSG